MSQAGVLNANSGSGGLFNLQKVIVQAGTSPVLVSPANTITFNGAVVAAGTNPVRTDGTAPFTMALEVQTSQAIASTDATKIGLAAFDSTDFSVDANGFVSLMGTAAVEHFTVDAFTAPGTNPVVPSVSGNITITGAQVAAGTTTNVIRTDSLAANTYTVEIQRSQTAASSTVGDNGVSHFNSAQFSVDGNGFVSATGTIPIQFTGNTGTAAPAAGNINILAASTAAGTSPASTAASGSTVTVNVQKTQAIAATDATKVGLANFDSAAFDVDANGFVQLNGGGIAATAFDVQANTAPGTDPVVPSASGVVIVNGAAVANHSVVLETRSRAANAYNVEVQYATSAAATDATKSGVAHFDSARFSVDASGFVTLNGSGVGETITGNSGGALSPTAGNWNIVGGTVVAGTSPLVTAGSGSTLTINAQRSQALAAADSTKVGLSNFDSSVFTVDANGFVSGSTTGFLKTLTGNTGGAIAPVANNINTVGSGSITIAGSGSTLTTQLTGLTNHAVLVGAGTDTITKIAATANTGAVLQNNSGADPSYSTATYPSTTTVSQILYSSATNVVSGLATANKAVLTTGATGVPVLTALSSDGQLIIGSTSGVPAAATLTAGTGISITTGSNSISIATTGTTFLTITSVNHAASPYTVLTTDEFLACQTSTGTITLLLPNAPTTGRVFIIKDSNGAAATSNISVTTVGGTVTIDGATTYKLISNYASINVIFDGTNYEIY